MKPDWRWLFFQIGVPLVGPAVLAILFVGAWQSVDPDFIPQWSVILDLTPWAIVVYSLTLIGGTFDRSWRKLGKGALSSLWVRPPTPFITRCWSSDGTIRHLKCGRTPTM